MQQRAQPPRYEGRGYFRDAGPQLKYTCPLQWFASDWTGNKDLEFHQPNQMIQPCRFLYFALPSSSAVLLLHCCPACRVASQL